jgi:hypothetical protein
MPSVTYRSHSYDMTDFGKIAEVTAEVLSCNGASPTKVASVSIGWEQLAAGKPWLVVHCKPRSKSAATLAHSIKERADEISFLPEDLHVYVFDDIDAEVLA